MVLSNFVKEEALKAERKIFAGGIITVFVLYVGISIWLNAIRTFASLWFIWMLIIIQILLYFSIFSMSWSRSKICGLNSYLGFIIFVTLAILGRVNNWELVIIPLVIITMLIVSTRAKNQQLVGE